MSKNKQQTQWKRILRWLESGKSLTALQALPLFGCLALREVIYQLRSGKLDGIEHTINTEIVHSEDKKKQWAKYSIPVAKEQSDIDAIIIKENRREAMENCTLNWN